MKTTVITNEIPAEDLDQMLMELDSYSAIMIIGEDEILVHDSYGSQRFDATDGDYPDFISISFHTANPPVTCRFLIGHTEEIAKARLYEINQLGFYEVELVEFTTEDRQNGYGIYLKPKEES